MKTNKKFESFQNEIISSKVDITGGKRVKTGGAITLDCNGENPQAYASDVRVYRHGKLVKIIYDYI